MTRPVGFDAVAFMRSRREEIDREDEGLSWEERARKTRELLGKVKPGAFGVHASDYMRAQAAIAVAEGDAGSANESLSRALAASPLWAAGPRAWLLALQEVVESVSQRPSNQPFHPTSAGRARG